MIREEDMASHVGVRKQTCPRWEVVSKEIIAATYLQKVGVVTEDREHIQLKGICLQVSHPGDPPFTIDVILRKPLPGKVEISKCTCTGGASGECKHAVALLKYISM